MATSPSFERRFEPAQSESSPNVKFERKKGSVPLEKRLNTRENYEVSDKAKSESKGHLAEKAVYDWLKSLPLISDVRFASNYEDIHEDIDLVVKLPGDHIKEYPLQISYRPESSKRKTPDIIFIHIEPREINNGKVSSSLQRKIGLAIFNKMPSGQKFWLEKSERI